MAKKTFNKPITGERKGLALLIQNEQNEKETESYYAQSNYINSTVRVRKDFREKIYTLKGRTGKSITDIYDMIFEDYFKKNPL